MAYAERNRLIKKVLTAEFGPVVTVRGSRGTATGWVTVKIDKRPKDAEERDAWKARVWELFKANGIKIGSYGYDDPGSDYGYGSTIHIDFGIPLDEFRAGERVTWAAGGMIGSIVEPNYRQPGWYSVRWDDDAIGAAPQEFYKRDLKRHEPGAAPPAKPRVRVKAGRKVVDAEGRSIPPTTWTPETAQAQCGGTFGT